MARDSLRATLDELKLDEQSATERPYLEAMLRRLGYTETEIRQELGPPIEADAPAPETLPQDFGADDEVAPAREYRLVIPARESAFAFESPQTDGPDSPFEALERVEFEESSSPEETVEFAEVAAGEATEGMPLEEFQEAPLQEFTEAPVEELRADEEPAAVEDVSIDTFGGPDVGAQPKTRVRMKRVRARSMQEAESKVASGNRRVIKSIPVDIVERWGAAPPGDKGAKK
ncbi:MAG: hypothetical protein AABY18_04225 [Candidatus Thermoplasmatota archaeon]